MNITNTDNRVASNGHNSQTAINNQVIKIAITGAAGQISYSIIFRIASGELFDRNTKIVLNLIDLEAMQNVLHAIKMELMDCAFANVVAINVFSDIHLGFEDIDIAFLIGAKPRMKGMERSDLLKDNGEIFAIQGKALDSVAKKNVKALVVGNPANTNCLIAIHNAKNRLTPHNFSAMMRLDYNRLIAQLANKINCNVSEIQKVVVWGNHSANQYPDIRHAVITHGNQSTDKQIISMVDHSWVINELIPTVQTRGAKVIEMRGSSSAASAANAAIDHMRDWVFGTNNLWTSMGVLASSEYVNIKDVVYGFPVKFTQDANGNMQYSIIKDVAIDEFSHKMMQNSFNELIAEMDAVKHLL